MAIRQKRERASCLSETGRRRRSVTEISVFSTSCRVLRGIIYHQYHLYLHPTNRVKHHVIHSAVSDL